MRSRLKDKVMSWSVNRVGYTTHVHTLVAHNLVLVAEFTLDHIKFSLNHTRNPKSVLSELDSGVPFALLSESKKMKEVALIFFDNGEAEGRSEFQARCAHVRALNFISDPRMNAMVRAVGQWFTLAHRHSLLSQMITFKPTSLNSDSATLLNLFDEGFDRLLDDAELPEMERYLMFLSVLVSTSYDYYPEALFGGEVFSRHLSVDMCRSIVRTLDVKPLIAGRNGWASGFRLCFPGMTSASTDWFDGSWKRSGFGIDDGDYLLASRLFCALADVDPATEVNGVVPVIPERADMCGKLHGDASSWVLHEYGVETTGQMLKDVKRLSRAQAAFVIQYMCRIMSGRSTSRYLRRLSATSLRTAKRLIFEQILPYSPDFNRSSDFSRWSGPVAHCLSLLPADVRSSHGDLIANAVRSGGNETDAALFVGMVASMVNTGVRDGRLGEVLHYWAEKGSKAEDVIPAYRASIKYLNEAHEDESDYLPFEWWYSLNFGSPLG